MGSSFGKNVNNGFGSSGAGGGGGSNIYAGPSPSTVVVENYPIGSVLTGKTYDELLGNIYAPYTAPTLSLVSITPGTQPYNQLNVACSVTFRFTKGAGTPDLQSAQIQYQRSGDVGWTNLTTTTSPVLPSSSTPIDASASVTVNTSTPNNNAVLFRCTFTDSTQANTITSGSVAFLSYVAPTAALTLTTTPSLTSNKMIRSLGTATQVITSGTITRNSINIPLSQYKIQRSYNNSSWTDLIALTAIAAGGGTLAANGGNVTDNTQPANQNAIYVRAFVTDSQVPAGQAVSATSAFGIYQPVIFGMTSESNPALVDLSALALVPNGATNTGGNCNYQNTSADTNINGLSYTASSNRFCIAFDAAYNVSLTTFFDTGTNLNLYSPSNFSTNTQTVTFADGTTKTYKVYVYNSVVASGTYIINVATA